MARTDNPLTQAVRTAHPGVTAAQLFQRLRRSKEEGLLRIALPPQAKLEALLRGEPVAFRDTSKFIMAVCRLSREDARHLSHAYLLWRRQNKQF
jgi:hypothetical protein